MIQEINTVGQECLIISVLVIRSVTHKKLNKLLWKGARMMNIITGMIDGTINFCPYCGDSLDMISFISETKCGGCGRPFYVIEGESEVQEDET